MDPFIEVIAIFMIFIVCGSLFSYVLLKTLLTCKHCGKESIYTMVLQKNYGPVYSGCSIVCINDQIKVFRGENNENQ